MAWLVTKYLVTAALVVLVSEVAKRSDRVGALLVALPLVTILSLLAASAALTVVCFWAFARVVKPFGIDLGL